MFDWWSDYFAPSSGDRSWHRLNPGDVGEVIEAYSTPDEHGFELIARFKHLDKTVKLRSSMLMRLEYVSFRPTG